MDDNLIEEKLARIWDQFRATQQALDKSEVGLTAYKLSSNEFRGALSDQAARKVGREEYETRHMALIDKINMLERRFVQESAAATGRSSGISSIGYIIVSMIGGLVGIASVTSVLVTLLHTPAPSEETLHKLENLTNALNQHLGRLPVPEK